MKILSVSNNQYFGYRTTYAFKKRVFKTYGEDKGKEVIEEIQKTGNDNTCLSIDFLGLMHDKPFPLITVNCLNDKKYFNSRFIFSDKYLNKEDLKNIEQDLLIDILECSARKGELEKVYPKLIKNFSHHAKNLNEFCDSNLCAVNEFYKIFNNDVRSNNILNTWIKPNLKE